MASSLRAPGPIERLAPLSGVGFTVLALLALGLWSDLGFLDPPEELAAVYLDDTGKILAGAQLLVLAAFLLVWFGGSVRAAVRAAEGGADRLAAIAFGGSVAAAGLLLAGTAVHASVALRADDAGDIDPTTAASLTDLAVILYAGLAPVALGILTAAVAVAALRTGQILPTWLAWLSALLAVGLVILPINFIVVLGFLAWAVAVGILLFVRSGPAAEAASA